MESRGLPEAYEASKRLLEASWSCLGGVWVALGVVMERLRSLPRGLTEIGPRSTGGKREFDGASQAGHGPWGAPLIKDDRLITTTKTDFMQGLTTPWAKAPAICVCVCVCVCVFRFPTPPRSALGSLRPP